MSQTLHLQLLGSPYLELDSKPLTGLTIGKAQGLLYYLAVTGQPHTRESISSLLWPETSTSQARENLRNLLPHVRSAVDPYLVITRDTLAFDRQSTYWLDVEVLTSTFSAYRSESSTGPVQSTEPSLYALSQAVALYRGDFLAGFYLQNAPEFEAWTMTEREHLRALAIDSMALLIKQYKMQGDYEAGVATAKELLALDPWRETTHQQLMMLLAQMGNRSAALTQYTLCQEMLADEFGVEPMQETTALYEQIKAGHYDKMPPRPEGPRNFGDERQDEGMTSTQSHPFTPSRGAPRAHPLTPAPVTEVPNNIPTPLNPLIGREEELTYIEQKLANADCRLLTLTGLGGTGKTRLALEAAKRMSNNSHGPPIFPDGVYFVSLLQIDELKADEAGQHGTTEPLALAIAKAINLTLEDKATWHQQLCNHLADISTLLVLDNFEHLLPYRTLIQQTLQQVPTLKILVTSRVPLHVSGEWTLPLTGLATVGFGCRGMGKIRPPFGSFCSVLIKSIHAPYRLQHNINTSHKFVNWSKACP